MDRIVMIESVGNLLELKMNKVLADKNIELLKNEMGFQEYFFKKDSNLFLLNIDEMTMVFDLFKKNFSEFNLGCCVFQNQMNFGIAHLSTSELENVIQKLQNII
jgi:hypothetical protein